MFQKKNTVCTLHKIPFFRCPSSTLNAQNVCWTERVSVCLPGYPTRSLPRALTRDGICTTIGLGFLLSPHITANDTVDDELWSGLLHFYFWYII